MKNLKLGAYMCEKLEPAAGRLRPAIFIITLLFVSFSFWHIRTFNFKMERIYCSKRTNLAWNIYFSYIRITFLIIATASIINISTNKIVSWAYRYDVATIIKD